MKPQLDATRRRPLVPIDGYLIIDPTGYTTDQQETLQQQVSANGGWLHPDDVHWIIPVPAPSTTRETFVRHGLPSTSIEIAR